MILRITLTIALSLTSLLSFALQERVNDFALLDASGKFHQLSYYGDHDSVLIVAQDSRTIEDPKNEPYFNKLAKLVEKDKRKVFLLNSSRDSRERTVKALKELTYPFPVLMDETQLVSKALGLSKIGDMLLIEPDYLKIVERGSIDSILQALSDQGVSNTASLDSPTQVAGEIDFYEETPASYAEDIAPLLEKNCVACHRDGAIGPWSMSSYEMIRGWAPMIKEVVMTKRMPPGQIDEHVGKKIHNVSGLSVEERRMLIDWIDGGAINNDDIDPLARLEFADSEFTLGEPDLVLDIPPQKIPATGVIDYRYVPVNLNLDRDVWLQAMEFAPGDRQVLHHIIAYETKPAGKSKSKRGDSSGQGENIGGFAPGRQPDVFHDNSGKLITAGSNLLLQMHYTTSGRETTDATKIGLFFHDKPPKHIMSGGVAGQTRFMVPPGAKEHKLSGTKLVERDAYLYELMPHMHFRGKYMSYTAEYPDGTSETLLSVPKYDFNWQFKYQLEEPLFLPAGTKIVAKGAMDNSDRNLGNPDPNKPVFYGLQTMHEMFFGFLTLRYVGDTPEGLLAETNLSDQGDSAGR